MNITLKQEEEVGYSKRESIDISLNGHGLVKASRDKSDQKGIFIKLKAKGHYKDKNTFELKEQNISTFLELLYDLSEVDTIDLLEKNVYVLPFASSSFKKTIDRLKDLAEMIDKK